MSSQKLTKYVPQDMKSTADVRYVVRYMMEKLDNLELRKKYSRYGVNFKDLKDNFPKIIRQKQVKTLLENGVPLEKATKAKGYALGTYRNRCRDNVYLGYFRVHKVDGLNHWYPLDLEVDHSRCSCPR